LLHLESLTRLRTDFIYVWTRRDQNRTLI